MDVGAVSAAPEREPDHVVELTEADLIEAAVKLAFERNPGRFPQVIENAMLNIGKGGDGARLLIWL